MTAGLFRRQLRIVQEQPGLSLQKLEPLQDPLSAANVNVLRPIRALACRSVVDKRKNEESGRWRVGILPQSPLGSLFFLALLLLLFPADEPSKKA